MQENKFQTLIILAIHAVMGYVSIQSPLFCMIWGVATLVIGLYVILKNNNANNEAALYAAYWVGMEILLRMNKGSLTYESGKYGVIILLVVGLMAEDRPFRFPRQFLVFFLLLLPALTVIEFESASRARKDVLFNLSGPCSLVASAAYFYKREMTQAQLNQLFLFFIMPIFALAVVLFFKTPDLSEVTFTLNSNRALSGGFGANQVSTVLGLGIFIVGLSLFSGYRMTGFKVIDVGLVALFGIRGLLTFSRGGIITAIGALFVAIFIFATKANNPQLVKKLFVTGIFVILAGLIVFNYTNELTGGFLKRRYANESSVNGKKRDFTTGRLKILMSELAAFGEYPILGAGIGMGKYYRVKHGSKALASHTEFSRLLAEHGLYGLLALLILLFSPLVYYLQANDLSKPLVAAFTILCFLTMTHGAMRLAMPGFLYGLIFIHLLPSTDDSLHREQT
ncbi:MAG: O-antigen ligase family protein [Cytophagales bacterium]|nr:O-antigen ligase family protein [Cytophagales bacterium]